MTAETFTASNGVKLDGYGGLTSAPLSEGRLEERAHEARKEFYQHLRDKELSRWRWPENPNYVVYALETPGHTGSDYRECTVVDERRGLRQEFGSDLPQCHGGEFREAARAYFAAHPDPKPWHDAKDGQLWLIRFSDFPEVDVSALVKGGRFVYNDHCHAGIASTDDATLVAARRIWPEGDQ